jgi:hypothetical protein
VDAPCADYFCCGGTACVNNTAGEAVCAAPPGRPAALFLSMNGNALDVIVRPPTQTGGTNIGGRGGREGKAACMRAAGTQLSARGASLAVLPFLCP